MQLCSTGCQYRYQHKYDVAGPDGPSQDLGHWSWIILRTIHAYLDAPRGVLIETLICFVCFVVLRPSNI